MRERRVVSIEKVREVLRAAGRSELMGEVLSDKKRPIKLKRKHISEIESRLEKFGEVIVKARKDGKGVILYGSEHIRYKFHFSQNSKAARAAGMIGIKAQGKKAHVAETPAPTPETAS